MGITNDNKTDFFDNSKEDFTKAAPEQLWIKGIADVEGYFYLENYKVPKVLTWNASSSELEIKGNIILRWIPGLVTNCWLFTMLIFKYRSGRYAISLCGKNEICKGTCITTMLHFIVCTYLSNYSPNTKYSLTSINALSFGLVSTPRKLVSTS